MKVDVLTRHRRITDPGNHLLFDAIPTERGILNLRLSRFNHDSHWDEFLQQCSLGQFQQSSMWGRYKHAEGWEVSRIIATLDGECVGGFQVLIHNSRLGRIGFVNKGPVAESGIPELKLILAKTLIRWSKQEKLRAVILQAPDEDLGFNQVLYPIGFQSLKSRSIVSATLIIKLDKGINKVEGDITSNVRKQIRQAVRRGVTIRQTGEQGIECFYKLVLATCDRQKALPNPGSIQAMQQLYYAFSPENVRLTLAVNEGEVIAGQLCLMFGKNLTLWKRGWSGLHSRQRPNQLLTYDVLKWASSNGYGKCDFASLDRDIAHRLVSKVPLLEHQYQSRDAFHLGFGGEPVLLPQPLVYFPNPAIRSLYRALIAFPFFTGLARRFIQ